MINYARKYPFLFTTPPLVCGVIIGNQIVIDNCTLMCLCISVVIFMITVHKFCNTSTLLLTIPLVIVFIGIIASQLEICRSLNLPAIAKTSISPVPAQIRNYLISKNQALIENDTNCALSNAITLGYREQLPTEIKTLFSQCGIMHIVAVSGLHVGIIFLMITKSLSFLRTSNSFRKHIALILIWIYTFIVGMPQSVIRASAILTYITIAENNEKSYSSINGIFACAFITTLISPQSINQVSFQLSYAAYLGIATLFPLFSPAKKGGNEFLKKIIASIAISIAAQLATMPITLYYFHGISINSFIINLAVIPLLSILLYADIFALILPYPFSNFLGEFTNITCHGIIKLTRHFETINIYIDNININISTIFAYYLVLFIIFFTLSKRRRDL